ncbi:MAG TPA: response regulator [Pyrinomonadaceae bacterium]|nr:response regulator [Pyrinomonadaceae bacterium]
MNPHQKRVLCVEDDADTCSMLSSLLGLINCEVTSAGTAAEAREKIKADNFDLYILDNWLPGASGVELCLEIREHDSTTPIMFYSGAGYDSDREQAMNAGAQAYLVKPSDIANLLETAGQLLEGK